MENDKMLVDFEFTDATHKVLKKVHLNFDNLSEEAGYILKEKAIPIEWIERYIKLHNLQLREDKRHGRGKIIEMQEWALFTLKGLLEDWEKENGQKN